MCPDDDMTDDDVFDDDEITIIHRNDLPTHPTMFVLPYEEKYEAISPYPDNPAHITEKMLGTAVNRASLYDATVIGDQNYLPYFKFFGQIPISQDLFKSFPFEANIFRHAFAVLRQTQELKIYSFDEAAAQSRIKTSATTTALTPARGTFVLEMANLTGRENTVIMSMASYGSGMSFSFYGLSFDIINNLIDLLEETAKNHNYFRNKVIKQDGTFVDLSKSSKLSDAILPEELLTVLQENVIDFFAYKMKLLVAKGLAAKRGLIFEGKPGVGKSFTVRALATTLGVSFIVVTHVNHADDIVQLYKFARAITPVVIVFEDIDIYLFDRSSGDRNLSVLLNELDGIEQNNGIVTLLTTNEVGVLDKAVKNRPGRFDRILRFEKPNTILTKRMLQSFCRKFDTEAVDFDKVVEGIKSDEYTGASLQDIVYTACLDFVESSMNEDTEIILTTDRLLNAAKKMRLGSGQKPKKLVGFGKGSE